LINKIDRSYHAHHIIDEDLMNNQSTENSMKLIVDGNDKVNLNKLIKLNIKIKTKEKSLYNKNIFILTNL
jgi:hypothetical protein